MPTPINRPSLTTNLESRYVKQRVGGAFDVKLILKDAYSAPSAGDRMPINGIQEQKYTVKDFVVKGMQGVTELKDALASNGGGSSKSLELSTYIKGIDTRKYLR